MSSFMVSQDQKDFTVEDENGRRYILSGKSWEGGQGKVIVDSTGKFIIKLRAKKADNDLMRDYTRQQIRRVRLLPLDNLPLASPLALLKPPHVGYVMKYLTGMVPIESWIDPPPSVVNEEVPVIDWYNQTGGLKRRLRILSRLANVINRLHGKSLVYGDLSPKNVLISETVAYDEVYLIDLDNLCYESSAGELFIRTEFFCAPEVYLKKHGVDTLTDAYSFAVLAFWILTLKHPFEGELYDYGEYEEMRHLLNSGRLPWLFHSSDHQNSSEHVLPKDIVISKKLFELFRQTFEDGLEFRKARPGMGAWVERLHTALRFTLECQNCHGSYYAERSECPWCEALRKPYLFAVIEDFVIYPDLTLKKHETITGVCLQYPGKYIINRRMLGYNDDEADQEVLELEIDQNLTLRARNLCSYDIWVVHEDWKLEKGVENGHTRKKIGDAWQAFPWTRHLHLGPLHTAHPVIHFVRK